MILIDESFLTKAKELVDAVQADDHGRIVAGRWVGGNGGLLSAGTLAVTDQLRALILVVAQKAPATLTGYAVPSGSKDLLFTEEADAEKAALAQGSIYMPVYR